MALRVDMDAHREKHSDVRSRQRGLETCKAQMPGCRVVRMGCSASAYLIPLLSALILTRTQGTLAHRLDGQGPRPDAGEHVPDCGGCSGAVHHDGLGARLVCACFLGACAGVACTGLLHLTPKAGAL